jgi:deoxyhypusine synthase
MDDDEIKNVRKEFDIRREDVDIALTKSLSDILSQFEQQKFEMESQRRQLEISRKMANEQANTKYFGIF